MRSTLTILFCLLFYALVKGQTTTTNWYSEYAENGIIIQNSYPKGGPYPGPTEEHFNYSYLVFYSRVCNDTETLIELNISFSADSIAIPGSPHTFVRVFLPPDTMTLVKQHLFSYGLTRLPLVDQSTTLHQIIQPNEEYLFYSVALFYQTKDGVLHEDRGGNRAEFTLNGKDLIYNLLPQVDALICGRVGVMQ